MKKLLNLKLHDLPISMTFVKDETDRTDISNILHDYIQNTIENTKKTSAKISK